MTLQTLGLGQSDESQGGGKVGTLGSVLIIPLLPLIVSAGLISIPISWAMQKSDRRKEARFAALMRTLNRTIGPGEADEYASSARGTFLREWKRLFKGPVRLWWTPDDIYEECGPGTIDLMTFFRDAKYKPLHHRCWFRYTDVKAGRAMLVFPPERKLAIRLLEDKGGDMRVIDIPRSPEGRSYH